MKTTKRKQGGFTLIELLVVITIIATLAGLSVPVFARVQENGNITKGINNVRQIFFGFGLYANDNDGRYPRGDTANAAFRKLVQDQLIEKEDVFGCPGSPYVPDNNLGEAPDYAEAVEANENHWMMVNGLSSSSGGAVPLLFGERSRHEHQPTMGRWTLRSARARTHLVRWTRHHLHR